RTPSRRGVGVRSGGERPRSGGRFDGTDTAVFGGPADPDRPGPGHRFRKRSATPAGLRGAINPDRGPGRGPAEDGPTAGFAALPRGGGGVPGGEIAGEWGLLLRPDLRGAFRRGVGGRPLQRPARADRHGEESAGPVLRVS